MADPCTSELSPDQRFKQLAAILALGVRRYQRRLHRSETLSGALPKREGLASLDRRGDYRSESLGCERTAKGST
jgi:hypothetical protein